MAYRLALPLLALTLTGIAGADPVQPVANQQRTVVVPKNALARDLAAVLGEHFKGSEVTVLADPSGAALLVSAPQLMLAETLKTIEQIDRRPRQVAVEVVLAEVKAAGEKGEEERFDPRELAGPADGLALRLETFRRVGRLPFVRHVRLTIVDGQKTVLQTGEEHPFVSARMGGGGRGGPVGPVSLDRRSVGTIVDVLARVAPDGQVKLDLNLEDSRAAVLPAGQADGTLEGLSYFPRITHKGAVVVPPGKAILASSLGDESKPGRPQTVIIVTARVVEPGDAR